MALAMVATGGASADAGPTVFRINYDPVKPQEWSALRVGTIVIPSCPASAGDALAAYLAATASKGSGPVSTPGGCIVAAGPMLDGPDAVSVGKLDTVGNELRLKIAHTQVRRSGMDLLRNVPWRPLVAAPLPALRPGQFKLSIIWQAVKSLTDSEPFSGAEQTTMTQFNVISRE
jgi:hypothetical protein